MKKKLSKKKLLTFRIPEKMHQDFKLWCVKNKTNMSIEMIRSIELLIYKKGCDKK